MKQSLYGKYPGVLKHDAKYIENCSEMELFIIVSKYYETFRMSSYLNKMIAFSKQIGDSKMVLHFEKALEDETKKNPLAKNNAQEYSYTLDYCLLQTARFNTNISYNPNGRIAITDEFKNWYENWQMYIATLDKNCYEVYAKCRYEGKSLQHFSENIASPTDSTEFEEINNVNSYKLQKNIRQISA